MSMIEGQQISKQNCWAITSPKKGNKWIWFSILATQKEYFRVVRITKQIRLFAFWRNYCSTILFWYLLTFNMLSILWKSLEHQSPFRICLFVCSRVRVRYEPWALFVLAYRKVASSNTSRLEAHAGFFRLVMKEIFDPYVLWPFDKKLIS